jgi:hypothetical protein
VRKATKRLLSGIEVSSADRNLHALHVTQTHPGPRAKNLEPVARQVESMRSDLKEPRSSSRSRLPTNRAALESGLCRVKPKEIVRLIAGFSMRTPFSTPVSCSSLMASTGKIVSAWPLTATSFMAVSVSTSITMFSEIPSSRDKWSSVERRPLGVDGNRHAIRRPSCSDYSASA